MICDPAGCLFRIAGFAAFPFGRRLVDAELLGEQVIPGTGLVNFLWIILAGLWLAIAHVLAGLACLTSIVGKMVKNPPVSNPSGATESYSFGFTFAQVNYSI